jgi:hypothetical protein
MPNETLNIKEAIKSIVHASVESFAVGFQGRHEGELDDPEGTLNMKIHNVFIVVLGPGSHILDFSMIENKVEKLIEQKNIVDRLMSNLSTAPKPLSNKLICRKAIIDFFFDLK